MKHLNRRSEIIGVNRKDIYELPDNRLTRGQLAEKLNISPETIKKNIEELKAKKILKRIGPDKGGHWEIV